MIFIAKLSPKQIFTFNGTKYQAQYGQLITEDEKLIDYLSESDAWETVLNSKTEVVEVIEKVETKVKKESKKKSKADKK